MPHAVPFVVFTDLDGTLLDGTTFAADAAVDAIGALSRAQIPLVFCSRKTRAEIELLQQRLDVHHPFIAENGGALYIPDGYFTFDVPYARPSTSGYIVVQYGRPYAEVVQALSRAARRARVPVLGFNEMSVEDVARVCELPLLSARLAKLREYSEPFRIVASARSARRQLEHALNAEGFACSAGGPFDLAGFHRDQGLPVRMLITLYRRSMGRARTVGLGDGFDDVPLLRRVDMPVVVTGTSPERSAQLLGSVPHAVVTRAAGPAGWAQQIIEILTQATADG
jgi:mannosyl-3-phosphoglycerate phosphatase